MRRLLLLGMTVMVLVALSGTVNAGTITLRYTFETPEVTQNGDYSLVSIPGLISTGHPGEPSLPIQPARVLLPAGEDVAEISVQAGAEVMLDGTHLVSPVQMQVPLSYEGPYEMTLPDPRIYSSSEPFPRNPFYRVTTERGWGYRIAYVNLFPVVYQPADGKLAYFEELTLTVRTEASLNARLESERLLRLDERTQARVSTMVDNPDLIATYHSLSPAAPLGSKLSPDYYPYLIITGADYVSDFQPLADDKTAKGLRATIMTVEEIYTLYTEGGDNVKVRNFIIDAYSSWAVEYVLLAGDKEVVPCKGLYATAGGTPDFNVVSDLFFGGLDGTWNDDGDGMWGEPEEADLIPEVSVGRAPIDSHDEATNFVNKTLMFQNSPVASQCTEALMAGELLWDDPTWGGDSKDEIKFGASIHGYTTVGFPDHFNVGTLYDRDVGDWSKYTIIDLMNNGIQIINHLGHANNTYALKMYDSDVDTRFTNDGVNNTFFFIYTQGCYCNAFDNRTSGGGSTTDAISEYFVTVPEAAVAFVGNTRYGWGAHASTDGASQYFDRQFFDALFEENIYELAPLNDDSKVDNISYVGYDVIRWCYYELCAMGDPELDLWTDTPAAAIVDHAPSYVIGQGAFEVYVSGPNGLVAGARVCLSTDDQTVFCVGYTDQFGFVRLDPGVTTPGTLNLVAVGHDLLTYKTTIDVVTPEGAFLALMGTTLSDDMAGESEGNGDGDIDSGEGIELVVTVENVGTDIATDVTATLICSDGLVTLNDDLESLGDIAPGESVPTPDDFDFTVSPFCPDGHVVLFELQMTSGAETWTIHMNFTVEAPELYVAATRVDDSDGGDGNGRLDPDESGDLYVTLGNRGSGEAENVSARLTCDDPMVYVTSSHSTVDMVDPDGTVELPDPFRIVVKPSCPEPYAAALTLQASAGIGYLATDDLMVGVGEFSDDMEAGEGGWTHYAVTDGYLDQWNLTTRRNHTDGGAYSWWCGLGSGYADYVDAALESPVFGLANNSALRFWHWMDSEIEGLTQAWDGGIVELRPSGGDWEMIYPEGGYPKTIVDNPASPFQGGTPCFGGSHSWQQEEFDLSQFSGTVSVRFRFGSDGYVTEEGWYIDDVEIVTDVAGVEESMDLLTGAPGHSFLGQNTPNPFNPVTTIKYGVSSTSHVSLKIFDVQGRLVRTLVEDQRSPGYYSIIWDGADTRGHTVASGMYFYRLDVGDFSSCRKMVVLE